MEYEFTNLEINKKEVKETDKKLNDIGEDMAKQFLKGVTFFITVPIDIYRWIKRRKK